MPKKIKKESGEDGLAQGEHSPAFLVWLDDVDRRAGPGLRQMRRL